MVMVITGSSRRNASGRIAFGSHPNDGGPWLYQSNDLFERPRPVRPEFDYPENHGLRGQNGSHGDIIDLGEVPLLGPVAEKLQGFSLSGPGDKRLAN
jgi:hypothetical protein